MSIQQMFLGGGKGEETIKDWFAIKTYDGDTAGFNVDNGLDMVGKEGLVWMKRRGGNADHALIGSKTAGNTAWGGFLKSNSAGSATNYTTQYITPASGGGFDINNGSTFFGDSGSTYVSWTFLQKEKFFDIVKYTGNAGDGVNHQTISHSLGCEPGMIIVKNLQSSGAYSFWVWHKDLGSNPEYERIPLDDYALSTGGDIYAWNSTNPTDSVFSVGYGTETNSSNIEHVAYIFAADQDYIKCGTYDASYTANSAGPTIDLGWKPQFLMVKQYTGNAHQNNEWYMFDKDRTGTYVYGNVSYSTLPKLAANTSDGENSYRYVDFTSTGFVVDPMGHGPTGFNGTSGSPKYIYMAIREPD